MCALMQCLCQVLIDLVRTVKISNVGRWMYMTVVTRGRGYLLWHTALLYPVFSTLTVFIRFLENVETLRSKVRVLVCHIYLNSRVFYSGLSISSSFPPNRL